MFPALRVQCLLRVAEDRYNQQTWRGRRTMQDTVGPSDRDLEGFYIYQNYVRRLRRLHRNYVKKYRSLQQEQNQPSVGHRPQQDGGKPAPFLPSCHWKSQHTRTTSPAHLAALGTNDWPATKFRVQASQSHDLALGQGKNFNQSQTLAHPMALPPIKGASPMSRLHARYREEGEEGGRREKPIYIPCGRESSEIRLQKLQKKKQQERDRGGALSFRMWRNVQGLSGTPYSS